MLKKSLLLLLPLLLVAAFLELGLRRMPTAMGLKRTGFEKRKASAELLVLGESESYQGLSPDALGIPGYNLANLGQDLRYDLELFKAVNPELPRLKAVIISVAYTTLEYRLPKTPEAWRQFQYALTWGLAPEEPGSRWDLRRWSFLALIEPLPALKDALKGFKGEPIALQEDGWQPLEPVKEELLDFQINDLTARKRASYHDGVLDAARDAEGQAWLRSLALAVKAQGCLPIFVSLPVTDSYARAVNPARLARMRDAVLKLSRELDAPYWDHFHDPSFTDAEFADPNHLDRVGAMHVGRIFKPFLIRALDKAASSRK